MRESKPWVGQALGRNPRRIKEWGFFHSWEKANYEAGRGRLEVST